MSLESRIVDRSETDLRDRDRLKWGTVDADVIAAWVAEMDFELDPVVTAALVDAVNRGITGYARDVRVNGVPDALSAFARARWGWEIDSDSVILVGDIMAGVVVALRALCEDAPVVIPTPAYPPFLDVAALAGRAMMTVPLSADDPVATLDIAAIEAALSAGARTVLLCNPHNPWGRAFSRPELEALRDVVNHHGARVISDEVHAPLVLPGSMHVPYGSLEGTALHTTTLLAASKAWNLPGLKCAQLITGSSADTRAVRALPLIANHGISPLGIVATRAAYRLGEPWLAALVARLSSNRDQFRGLVAEHVPDAVLRPMEATYLAWVDVRAYGFEDPAAVALERGRVMVNDGRTFGPGGQGHVRVNIATSPDRIQQIVERLARAWER